MLKDSLDPFLINGSLLIDVQPFPRQLLLEFSILNFDFCPIAQYIYCRRGTVACIFCCFISCKHHH